jgi:hypothetical protein
MPQRCEISPSRDEEEEHGTFWLGHPPNASIVNVTYGQTAFRDARPRLPKAEMTNPIFLALEEVVERYRGQISVCTLRNWRSMRTGPSFVKIGKAVLYPLQELNRWDRWNLMTCRPSNAVV